MSTICINHKKFIRICIKNLVEDFRENEITDDMYYDFHVKINKNNKLSEKLVNFINIRNSVDNKNYLFFDILKFKRNYFQKIDNFRIQCILEWFCRFCDDSEFNQKTVTIFLCYYMNANIFIL